MWRATVCTWLKGSAYLARYGDVGARRHPSVLGTKVDVHCALGKNKPRAVLRSSVTQDPNNGKTKRTDSEGSHH